MSGNWIALDHATPEKPEVFVMAERLKIDPDAVVGKLARLWIWADQQTYDGSSGLLCKLLVDRKAGVDGFADAMHAAGWLEVSEDGSLTFPRFGDHNGDTAKKRLKANQRQQRSRMSRSERDRNVTAELPQNRTGQNKSSGPVAEPKNLDSPKNRNGVTAAVTDVLSMIEANPDLQRLRAVSVDPVKDKAYEGSCLDILPAKNFDNCWSPFEETWKPARCSWVSKWYPKQLACKGVLLRGGNMAEAAIVLASVLAMQTAKASGKSIANKPGYWRRVVTKGNWSHLVTEETLTKAIRFIDSLNEAV